MKPKVNHFETEISARVKLDYLLCTPNGYHPKSAEMYPLVLFLHGAGQRGRDPMQVAETAIAEMVAQQESTPFILVAPQCPPKRWWVDYETTLIALLDSIIATQAVDRRRVYLTGLSMGGAGTWYLAAKHPDRFAAIAPICGASLWWQGFPEEAVRLKDMPVWTFHGEADAVVPISVTEDIVAVLAAQQADVRFTRYPGVEHDSWTQTYSNAELYQWLFAHQIENSELAAIAPEPASQKKSWLDRLLR